MTTPKAPLPTFTSGKWRLRDETVFVHWPEGGYTTEWLVLGPDTEVLAGAPCVVSRTTQEPISVDIDEIVAERIVHHKPDSRYGTGQVRYVLARIQPTNNRTNP